LRAGEWAAAPVRIGLSLPHLAARRLGNESVVRKRGTVAGKSRRELNVEHVGRNGPESFNEELEILAPRVHNDLYIGIGNEFGER
jgi:hypothetical protein